MKFAEKKTLQLGPCYMIVWLRGIRLWRQFVRAHTSVRDKHNEPLQTPKVQNYGPDQRDSFSGSASNIWTPDSPGISGLGIVMFFKKCNK